MVGGSFNTTSVEPLNKFNEKELINELIGFFLTKIFLQVMVTEGPGGEETSVYDITLSEIQSGM